MDRTRSTRFPLSVFAAALALASAAFAADQAGVSAAVKGQVALTREAQQIVGRQVASGEAIYLQDRIESGPKSGMQILLLDETVFTIGPDSALVIDEFVYDPNTHAGKVSAEVVKGVFRFVTGKVAKKNPENMKVELPVGTLGVRGTRVAGIADPNQSIAFLLGPDPQNPGGGGKDAFSASNAGKTEWIDDPGWGAKLIEGLPPEIFELPPETIEKILEALNNPEGVDWSQLAGLLEWLGSRLPEGNEPPWLRDVLEDQEAAQDAQDHSTDAGQDGESDSYYDNW